MQRAPIAELGAPSFGARP